MKDGDTEMKVGDKSHYENLVAALKGSRVAVVWFDLKRNSVTHCYENASVVGEADTPKPSCMCNR